MAILAPPVKLTTQCPDFQGATELLSTNIQYQYAINPLSPLQGSMDMVIDQSGDIYISYLTGVPSCQISKLNYNSSIMWSVTSSYWLFPKTLKLSPDASYLIYTDTVR